MLNSEIIHNKMQQLRLFFAMALLYMFRVTIPPIISSKMLYMAFQVGRYTVSLRRINAIVASCWNYFTITPLLYLLC